MNEDAWGVPGARTGQSGLQRLQDTSRMLDESQAVGGDVANMLVDQREKLIIAGRQRQEMHENILISRRLIDRMTNRAFVMKAMLCCIIMFLVLGIGAIIFMKWFHHSSPYPPPPPPPPATS
eukprot:CAMPEP_0181194208 /NCGR_PEP_ID=MMETSP1096-20121128/14217_1 /TAXON_ID=156174 ORGANISM="Chrysochromulina ericina, Strain CCMP281" /NCGR_SAMPLE_ID=MMETSP1096 /ASSEMBLY_ACC=CAM_ASM_000453 /LENGTH=121 /DNA_ID=CAMNT_0023283701 /DNA_START=27 /DNA_END=392 /DNA_ORIENTATION=-